mmetsp:Transcript_31385/g.69903  ORF Transcript_31385/g.69903 Transcript_31385/m.69903 type:complete len:486 (-) Transcript_31385:565-2022(-)
MRGCSLGTKWSMASKCSADMLALVVVKLLYFTAPRLGVHASGAARLSTENQGPGNVIDAIEAGVSYCTMELQGSAFASALNYSKSFTMHIFTRYTVWGNTVKIHGILMAERHDESKGMQMQTVHLDPKLQLSVAGSPKLSWSMRGVVMFPMGSTSIAAPVSSLALQFELPNSSGPHLHEYSISSFASDSTCELKPAALPNALDLRGIHVEIKEDVNKLPSHAYIVMSPLWNVPERLDAFAAILDRHIQHHRLIGFTRHVLYLRQAHLHMLVSHPRVAAWLEAGHPLIMLWDMIPPRPHLKYYDQRIVYSHATLAFTGMPVYLAMIDADEFVCPGHKDLHTLQDMLNCCRQGSNTPGVNVQVTRYNVLAAAWDHKKPEAELWSGSSGGEHPLTRYTLINWSRRMSSKSLVRPEFIAAYHIHYATAYRRYSPTPPQPACMHIAHVVHMFKARLKNHSVGPGRPFQKNDTWTSTLQQLRSRFREVSGG